MIKLTTLLREIGTGTAAAPEVRKASKWGDQYSFETDTNQYQVFIDKRISPNTNLMTYDVSFGVLSQWGTASFTKMVGDPKNIFKVMAAVVNSIRKEAVSDQSEGYEVRRIKFSAVKESASDKRRKELYMSYVNKLLPGEITEEGDTVIVTLPDGYKFTEK